VQGSVLTPAGDEVCETPSLSLPVGVVQLGTKTMDTKQNMVEPVLSMNNVLWGLRLEGGH